VETHLAVTLSAGKFALAHALPRLTERSGKSVSVHRTKKERKIFLGKIEVPNDKERSTLSQQPTLKEQKAR
jgi:hypothetical protein